MEVRSSQLPIFCSRSRPARGCLGFILAASEKGFSTCDSVCIEQAMYYTEMIGIFVAIVIVAAIWAGSVVLKPSE